MRRKFDFLAIIEIILMGVTYVVGILSMDFI